jgi:hypothetical protein
MFDLHLSVEQEKREKQELDRLAHHYLYSGSGGEYTLYVNTDG